MCLAPTLTCITDVEMELDSPRRRRTAPPSVADKSPLASPSTPFLRCTLSPPHISDCSTPKAQPASEMVSSEGSAHSQWRRFFGSAGGADIFEIINAAVAVAALDRPDDLKQRRERIAQRLYTGGILSCGDITTPLKGCRSVAVSKKEDRPPASSAEKAMAPVKTRLSMAVRKKEKATSPVRNLARKDCSARPHSTTPPAADLDRKKAPANPTEQSMEAMLATAKHRLKERYDECKDAKRQRRIQVVEAPEMAKQRRKSQHPIIRRRDEVRCAATIAERRALMSTLRASWV